MFQQPRDRFQTYFLLWRCRHPHPIGSAFKQACLAKMQIQFLSQVSKFDKLFSKSFLAWYSIDLDSHDRLRIKWHLTLCYTLHIIDTILLNVSQNPIGDVTRIKSYVHKGENTCLANPEHGMAHLVLPCGALRAFKGSVTFYLGWSKAGQWVANLLLLSQKTMEVAWLIQPMLWQDIIRHTKRDQLWYPVTRFWSYFEICWI